MSNAEKEKTKDKKPEKKPVPEFIRTLKFRLKDKHAVECRDMARWVNTVWNYDNELSFKLFARERKRVTKYDLQEYTKGLVDALGRDLVQARKVALCTRKRFKRLMKSLRHAPSNSIRSSFGGVSAIEKARAILLDGYRSKVPLLRTAMARCI